MELRQQYSLKVHPFVTILPAAMNTLSPIVTPFRTVQLIPTMTLSPIITCPDDGMKSLYKFRKMPETKS